MKRKNVMKPSAGQIELLRRTADTDPDVSKQAMRSLAQALTVPLRSALLNGDLLAGIYAPEVLEPGATATYPIDFFTADNEDEYIAYVIPNEGAIPQRTIVGDEVTVPTFDIANAIDWPLKYARNARWSIVARAMEVLEAGFVRKLNTDGMNAVVTAGAGRTDTAVISDAAATAGQFTKRLVSLMKTSMTRLAGGNSSTQSRGQLTDLYISPEALEDIRDWTTADDGVDEFTIREIFQSTDNMGNSTTSGPLARIFGVTLHSITELGVGQEFQVFSDSIGFSMGATDEEIVIGLDLQQNDSFVMPVEEQLTIFDDSDNLHRRRKAGFYGWQTQGFAVLDTRRCILGSF